VKCRPPENRQPEEDEVSTCSPFLLRQIDAIAPKVIVCLGASCGENAAAKPTAAFAVPRRVAGIRGRKLLATYHPAYLLRKSASEK